MTWTARVVVTSADVYDDGLVDVIAQARTGETYTVGDFTAQRVTSNTEGVIEQVVLTLVFQGEHSPVAVGDELTITGHFTAKPAAAALPNPAA